MSNSFDPLGEGDGREWLHPRPPSSNIRRFWFLLVILVVVLLVLWWIIFRGLFQGDKPSQIPVATTAAAPGTSQPLKLSAEDAKVVAAAQSALTAWGKFAVSGDLSELDDTFWKQGPQYKRLATEVPGIRKRNAGPPPYQFTLTPRRLLPGPAGQRVVRGSVRMSRPGEPTQSFSWDIYMQRVPGAGHPWRLWTVDTTPT